MILSIMLEPGVRTLVAFAASAVLARVFLLLDGVLQSPMPPTVTLCVDTFKLRGANRAANHV